MAQAQKIIPKRQYETIYILRPESDRATSEGISDRLKDVIAREQGILTRVENWGRRKLAYQVNKQSRGIYVYFEYLGGGGLVAEVERNLRLLDAVVKFQTVMTSAEVIETREVQPDDIKFEHVEPASDEEADETKAQRLGLEPRAGYIRSSERNDSYEEADEEGLGEGLNDDLLGES